MTTRLLHVPSIHAGENTPVNPASEAVLLTNQVSSVYLTRISLVGCRVLFLC